MSREYKIFRFILILLFVTFLSLYFGGLNGYYEYNNYKKMVMTDEKIKQFEEDVKNGLNVDITKYMENTDKNFQNGLSRFGLNISNIVSDGVKGGVYKTFSYLSKFVSE